MRPSLPFPLASVLACAPCGTPSRTTFIVLAALASLSCRGGDAVRPDDDGWRVDRTTVFVSDGAVFDWSPGCAVAVLRVEDETGGEMWLVNSPEVALGSLQRTNRIVPRVTYGIVPPYTGSPRQPVALVRGGKYRFVLWRAYAAGRLPSDCPPNDENLCPVAVQPFVTP
jgi:hypothetical protein